MSCGRLKVYRLDTESDTLIKDSDPDISEVQNMWLSKVLPDYPDLK